MGKVRSTNIEPEGATTALTLGASGDSVTVASTQLRTNTFKDAGGNTLWTSNGSGTLSSVNSALSGGGFTWISTATVSSAVTETTITSGIDSTYDEYLIIITDYAVATNSAALCMNFSRDGGSNYANINRTSAGINDYNNAGGGQAVGYASGWDLSNGTGNLFIIVEQENNANSNSAGLVHLWQPSNTTFGFQWQSRMSCLNYNNRAQDWWTSGFCNATTAAINAIQFKCNNGNMTNGVFQLYGVS